MARVVVIDDDTSGFDTLARMLKVAGHDFVGASCGREGMKLVIEMQPDVAVIDLRLGDMSGLQVLDDIRTYRPTTACIVLSGFWGVDVNFIAETLGARIVSKPCFGDELIRIIDEMLAPRHQSRRSAEIQVADARPHAAERVLYAGVKIIASLDDQPTLGRFCRAIGVARGTYRNWCSTAHVEPKTVRDLLRAVRAVLVLQRSPHLKADLGNVLEITDPRTIAKFCIKAGGRGGRAPVLPDSIDELLERQTFVENNSFIATLRAVVRSTRIQPAVRKDSRDDNRHGSGGPSGCTQPG